MNCMFEMNLNPVSKVFSSALVQEHTEPNLWLLWRMGCPLCWFEMLDSFSWQFWAFYETLRGHHEPLESWRSFHKYDKDNQGQFYTDFDCGWLSLIHAMLGCATWSMFGIGRDKGRTESKQGEKGTPLEWRKWEMGLIVWSWATFIGIEFGLFFSIRWKIFITDMRRFSVDGFSSCG